MAFGFLRDIFDANTESDQRKRLARGGKRLYAEDEKAKGNARPASNVVSKSFNFLKSAGESMASSYTRLSTGIAEAAGYGTNDQQKARESQANLTDQNTKLIADYGRQLKDPALDPNKRAIIQRNLDALVGSNQETFQQANTRSKEIQDRVDPIKGAAAVGSIGFDIATAGTVGTAAKGAKAGYQTGKVATREVSQELAKDFAEKQAAKTVAKRVGRQVATGAAQGAGSGALGAVQDKGSETTLVDAVKGAGTGAVFGGVLTGAAAGGGEAYRGFKNMNAKTKAAIDAQASKASGLPPERAISRKEQEALIDFVDHKAGNYELSANEINRLHKEVRKIGPKIGVDTVNSSVADLKTNVGAYLDQLDKFNQTRDMITSGGYAKLPGVADDLAKTTDTELVKKNLRGNVPDNMVESKAAAVAMTKDPMVIQRILAEPEVPKRTIPPQGLEVADAYAGEMMQFDQAAKGGQLIPDGEGGKIRTTEHSPFYSEYYKANKRPPSAAAYKEQALKELEMGRAPSTYQPFYDDAVNPETQSLLARGPEAPLTPEEQNALAARELSQDANQTPPPSSVPPRKPTTEGDGRTRKLGFIKTVEESGTTNKTGQEAVESIAEKEYKQKGNATPLSNARKFVEEDTDGALERFKTTSNITEDEVILGQALMEKFQKEGRKSEFVDVVEKLAEGGLGAGRTSQAFSVWSRLSPEGIAMLAERKLARKRAAISGGDLDRQAKGLAKEIQDEVENAVKLDKGDVKETLRGIVKDVEEEELTTGQKIAGKVERAISPKVKKQADMLVEEVTKKIKEEQLAPLPKANKRSATQILKDVFARNQEAQEAFPEAQSILREKFADNPKALQQLDTFFNSELGLPAASSTINSAIKEQLKLKGARVTDIISQSWANQKQSVDDIAEALTAEGFEPKMAKSLADEVVTRLNKQIGEAKSTVLERLAGDVPVKNQSTYIDKLNKLSNLGALDEGDYLKVARAKLDLPQLTPETAGRLNELSQKLQGLATDDPERYHTIKQIGEVIEEVAPPEKPSIFTQVLGAPRSMLASFDISGMGRQGLTLGTRFQKEFARSFKSQVKNFASEEQFNNSMARIAADPRAELMDKAGVALTGVKGYGKPEEAFASQLPEHIPLFGRGIKGSDRAYTGALTQFRADVFNNIMDKLEASGVDINAMPKEHLESIGKYINTASGRGVGKAGGYFEKHANGLSLALFSPRLWKSRLDMLNPKYYYDLKGPARKLALQNAATFAGTAAVVLSLAAAAGADVETDARSSDFLKIKVGDTRFDILGGFQQNLVFAHRQLVGEKKSSVTGKVTDLNEGTFGAANRLSILSDLIQNKENPTLAMATTQLKGQDKAGNQMTKMDRLREVVKLGVPISVLETGKAIKDEGLKGAIKSAPGFVGVGVGTYGLKDIQPTDKQKQYVKDLEANGAPKDQIEATRSFYQTLKVGPDRKKYSADISEAIKEGDLTKAKELSDEYNKKYAESFKDWKKKHGKYASDRALLDAYTKGKIKLTKASVKSRARNSKSIYEATRGQ